ncbi:sulfurtransferase [uncultured Brevundimonas sp.]|uniref:sulfurtransferase n=1 Tax=uncultured Brevundimonas sp. TaxID=213418 RepID=UPI00262D2C82|nr:sulfurtransferase [uncultured Brevundimonas sp.]
MVDTVPYVVSGEWLEARLGDPAIRIVDATTRLKLPNDDGPPTLESGRDGFARGHIPGAVFADVMDDFADPDAPFPITAAPSQRFAQAASALGIGPDTHVVVYDQMDAALGQEYYQFWASRFWWQLRLEGHAKVSVLDGGLGRWKREGRPVTQDIAAYPPAPFVAHRQPELLATVDQVTAAIGDPDTVLINVLDRDTFTGKRQPYARRGHIPSSQNLFFGTLVDPVTGGYRKPEDIRPLFEAVGALDPSKKPVFYCGGGIAATVAALQLAQLGRSDAAVYDGSMVEWTSDDSRPMATLEE